MSGYDLSRPVLEHLREAADIVAVVGEHVTLRKAGRNYTGLCPFHGEKTPSFSVSREKGTYYCFGCKRGGDVIDFVQELERVEFVEAVERLARRFGVDLPAASPQAARRRQEGELLHEALDAAQKLFSDRLTQDRPRAFLERRGVSLEAAARFGLGYAADEWRGLLDALHRRFPERVLLDAGLIVEGEGGRFWDRFRDRVTIPIRLARGTLVAFGGRTIGDEMPKYLNSPETALYSKGRVLFAADRAAAAFAEHGAAIVVEGYFDCLALHQAGFTNAVATCGTALTEHHARELARKVRRVLLCYDGDAAGRQATVAALRTVLAAQLEAAVVALPDGADPDDVVRSGGAAGFAALLEAASSPADFLLAQLGPTRDARRRGLSGALEVVDACPDPVQRFALRERLAQGAGVPVEQLGALRAPRVIDAAAAAELPPPGEIAVLRHLLVDLPPDRRAATLDRVPLEAVSHPATRAVLAALQVCRERDGALEISSLTAEIGEREVRRVLAALDSEAPPTPEERFELILRELWEKHRQQRLAELNAEISRAANSKDRPKLEELSREWTRLSKRGNTP